MINLGWNASIPSGRFDRVVLVVLLQVAGVAVGGLAQLSIDVLPLSQDL